MLFEVHPLWTNGWQLQGWSQKSKGPITSYNFAIQAFDTFSVGTTEDIGPSVNYLSGWM